MELSVVIVSYNVNDFLRRALQTIIAAAGDTEHEIIVVDNNSSDGSPGMVRNEFPAVRLIISDHNEGFSAAPL